MNSVSETKKIIASTLKVLPAVTFSLLDAYGFSLAEDLLAPADYPTTNQSKREGYAVRFGDISTPLAIIDNNYSNNSNDYAITAGQAMVVQSGHPLPQGADTVISGEAVHVEANLLTVEADLAQPGMNVVLQGSESSKGQLLMSRGEELSPSAIGFLASKGLGEVSVFRPPVMSIVSVGNEWIEPGRSLNTGEHFESCTYSLRAAIKQCNLNVHRIFHTDADRESIATVFNAALNVSDIILVTGCIDKDAGHLVESAIEGCGVDGLVNGVRQSPGNDLYFGSMDSKAIFILPGGPISVLTCFYEYVVQAIEIMTRKKNTIPVIKASMAGPFQKPGDLTYFLSGKYAKGRVTPVLSAALTGIKSFISFNCLIILPQEEINFQIGEEVEVHLLP